MPFLVFIDTNIYLDFYRYNNDVSLSLLSRVYNNRDRIITTAEIEMEYKKNRQKVILQSLSSIKSQIPTQLSIPSFLKESKYITTSQRLTKEWKNLARVLTARTEKLLESPELHDPVYEILGRLFNAVGPSHLTRGMKIRDEIRDKAHKRYLSGYPPRKPNDMSIGDSINWEWIIYCAGQCSDDIIIISRDTDYGQHHNDKSFINDWLLQEFKDRVSSKRLLKLTRRLSEGLKLAGITVPKAEEKAEDSLLTRYWAPSGVTPLASSLWTIGPPGATGPTQVGTAFASSLWTIGPPGATGPTGPTPDVFTYAVPEDSFKDSNAKIARFKRQSASDNVDTAIDKPKKEDNEPQNDNSDASTE